MGIGSKHPGGGNIEMHGDTSRYVPRAEAKRRGKKGRRHNDKVEVSEAPPIEQVTAEKRLADSEVPLKPCQACGALVPQVTKPPYFEHKKSCAFVKEWTR